MDAVSREGKVFPEKQDIAMCSLLMFEIISVMNSLTVYRLDVALLRPGHAIEQSLNKGYRKTSATVFKSRPFLFAPYKRRGNSNNVVHAVLQRLW